MSGVRTPRLIDQVGVRFGVGGAGLLVVTAVLVAAHLPTAWSLTGLLVATLLLGAPLTAAYAVAFGVAGWAFADGFLVHRYGELGFAVPELLLLAGFLAISVLPGVAATRGRR